MSAKKRTKPKYYVLESYGENHEGKSNGMGLYSIPNPGVTDRWLSGHKFRAPPKVPIVVTIKEGREDSDLKPYIGTPPVMSNEFYKALCDAGVDNLDVYDAVLQRKDGKVKHEGFKAFNVLGLVRAADLSKTKFNDPPGSRLIDASIDTLEIDPDKARGILMFRLMEYVSAVIVHERVKKFIEPMNFPYVQFNEPSSFTS